MKFFKGFMGFSVLVRFLYFVNQRFQFLFLFTVTGLPVLGFGSVSQFCFQCNANVLNTDDMYVYFVQIYIHITLK